MLLVDPVRLARRQIEIDDERTARFPHLRAHKVARMIVSPHALLRGSAPLFFELLERHPLLADGPAGEGWLAGDAHVENFGAYRVGRLTVRETQRSHAREPIVFDLNDFDDALVGPWRLDVVRLVTSLLLAARESVDGQAALSECDALLDAYVAAAFGTKRAAPRPQCVDALIERVRGRTRKQLLDARTRPVGAQRRFVLGPRYEPLPPKLRAKAERSFRKYAERLPAAERVAPEALEVVDAAFRVAGTGSLGTLRIALLVRGKGGIDGGWIFDMKAEGRPSAAGLGRVPKLDPGDRVCAALHACLARHPRMIGSTKVRGESMFVRRLAPQEDKLDFASTSPADRLPLARYLGGLLGAAHRRGSTRIPQSPWSPKERARVREKAVALAGIHEAIYLAYCDLVRR
jgi:uncharacterized protein (DUF2252 family)